MADKERPFDVGCIIGGVLASVFFMVPIVAWWIPVAWRVLLWIFRLFGRDV